MTSVSIVFRKNKLNKKGEAPVHIRITKDRKAKYISTGIMVHENNWDDANKKIKARAKSTESAETIARTNAKMWKQFNDIQNEVLKVDIPSRSISVKSIKETVLGKRPELFFPFANNFNQKLLNEQRIGTYDRYCTVISKLKVYSGDELYFSDITPLFLSNYENHLIKLGNKVNTIHSNLKVIRTIFNEAYRLDVIGLETNPFLKFKMKTEKTTKIYLSEEEVVKIEKVTYDNDTKFELHKDMFVFSCYAGGLRISDLLQLRWTNFDGTHINVKIKKTNESISIKLPNKALEILAKYRTTKSKPESFVFGMLPENVFSLDARALDSAISSSTAYINKNLKKIAEKAEISKNISFHTARHTWATRALRKGVSIDKVSKLMGHAAIKETQIYAKIVNEELDKAMDAFN